MSEDRKRAIELGAKRKCPRCKKRQPVQMFREGRMLCEVCRGKQSSTPGHWLN